MKASILIPTHDHAPLLRHTIASALKQTVTDIEVLVVGDGVGDDTREVVQGFRDARVRFFEFPKSPRTGEAHRHQVLSEHARGEVIFYLADDDLLFPNHVEEMGRLLRDADFAHTLPFAFFDENEVYVWTVDLTNPWYRNGILSGENRVPLTGAGHTLAFYKRLPHGWRTTPQGTFTDLYMWQQILGMPQVRAVSGKRLTAIHYPSSKRTDWDVDRRLRELSRHAARLGEEAFVRELEARAWEFVLNDRDSFYVTGATSLKECGERIAELNALRQAANTLAQERHRFEVEAAGLHIERRALEEALTVLRGENGKMARDREAFRNELASMKATVTWRLRNRLVKVKSLAWLVRRLLKGRAERGHASAP
ncbi:MAG: glycosyltransferase family A protein [Myxococcaceae bacterium]